MNQLKCQFLLQPNSEQPKKNKPLKVEDNKKGGWKPSGHGGGNLREGAYKKAPPGRTVTYEKGALPEKKSISELP